MPYETCQVTITDTPRDLAQLAGLDANGVYLLHNRSPASRVFLAGAASQPPPDGPAYPLAPGADIELKNTPPPAWVWCEAGETGTLIVTESE